MEWFIGVLARIALSTAGRCVRSSLLVGKKKGALLLALHHKAYFISWVNGSNPLSSVGPTFWKIELMSENAPS